MEYTGGSRLEFRNSAVFEDTANFFFIVWDVLLIIFYSMNICSHHYVLAIVLGTGDTAAPTSRGSSSCHVVSIISYLLLTSLPYRTE